MKVTTLKQEKQAKQDSARAAVQFQRQKKPFSLLHSSHQKASMTDGYPTITLNT